MSATTLTYTCVGSGTCVPTPDRGPACHLVEGEGEHVVLDLGSGSLRSLAGLGVPPARLTAVGVTHRHQDHVGDLLPLVFALRHAPDGPRTEPLVLFGYPGLEGDLRALAATFGAWVTDPGFHLDVRELPPGRELSLGARLRVIAHAVRHSPEAVAFRIESSSGAVLAYSGDSGPTPALAELAAAADLFVCECAFPDGHGKEGHLTPSELLPLAARSGARRVVATHLYPIWDRLGVDALLVEALRRFGRPCPPVTAAADGLRLGLGPGPAGEHRRTRPEEAPC